MAKVQRILVGLLALALFGLAMAPYSAAAQTSTRTYEVIITNITNGMQALSPPILITHPASVHAWQMGQPASPGIEKMAEEGMTDVLAAEVRGAATEVVASKAHLLPGDSITLHITAKQGDVLSAASMLIQTNDGFTGLDSVALQDGSMDAMAYDAGSEDNTEAKAHVPGPPFGGKNSGPASNPRGAIAMHETIMGRADVTPEFDWSGPVARFSIRSIPTMTVAPGTYDVTITNTTNSMQALSPAIVAAHPASAHAWMMGQPASKGLEVLAEEGMPDMLASELQGAVTSVATTKSHLFPGDSITVRVTAKQGDVLSAATMLIQTNDGFTGLDSVAITSSDVDAMAYDAGTEENTEMKADIPGPPFGGKNSGPASNPLQAVAMHETIMGRADVTPEFDWSGPVARFSIRPVSATAAPAPSAPSPGMPATGAADTTIWLAATLAAGIALLGVTLRRTAATNRR